VGIDVESGMSNVTPRELADRVFSPQEARAIRHLPQDEQRAAFFRCWTRKEAYVKARGEGLSFPLDRFEVPLAPGGSLMFLGEIRDRESASVWSLYDLPVENGYFAALVVAGDRCRLRFWQCPTGEGLW
jgi:4'-phosphopantetheinyl transferase